MGIGDVGEIYMFLSRSDRLLDSFQRTARVSLSIDTKHDTMVFSYQRSVASTRTE